MKKIVVAALLIAGSFTASAQTKWQGQVGTRRIILRIPGKDTSHLKLDLPEQSMSGMELESYARSGDTVQYKFSSYVGALKGIWLPHGAGFKGVLEKGEGRYPVLLTKTDNLKPLKGAVLRGLKTKYKATDITYYNADHSIRFGATLTVPLSKGTHPAIILISGGGKQDRDGNMAGHPVFAVLADYLSGNGYVVLRVDDRGTGKTTGVYETSATSDFAADVKVGINYLKTLPAVNKAAIGLIGHSEGGAVAFMTAANNKDVAFIITLAGLASTGLDAVIWQNLNIVESAPIPAVRKQRFNSLNKILFATVYQYADAPDLEQKLRDANAAWMISDSSLAKQDTVGQGHFFFPLESYIHQATGKWYREYIRYDPATYLNVIKVPILALDGSRDVQVDPVRSLQHIKDISAAAGNTKVTVMELDGLNHLFQHCQTCAVDESVWLNETISPLVLQQIGAWLKENVKQ